NGLAAWLIQRRAEAVSMDFWSVLIDTVITCLCISVFVSLCESVAARRYLRTGIFVKKTATARTIAAFFARFPRQPVLLGLSIAALTVAPVIILMEAFCVLCGFTTLTVADYMTYKSLWGGLFGSCVCALVLTRHQITRPEAPVYKAEKGIKAMREISEAAQKDGISEMSLEEINAEIDAVRQG
ncbi:MAG: hypothetical protein Q4C25_08830, partial [Bacillota bacterium]|nr:hypothetical protein [Bacillota bacterium]